MKSFAKIEQSQILMTNSKRAKKSVVRLKNLKNASRLQQIYRQWRTFFIGHNLSQLFFPKTFFRHLGENFSRILTHERKRSKQIVKVGEKFVCLTLTLLIVVRNWGHEELCNGLKVFLASQKSILCPRQRWQRSARSAASYANYARCTQNILATLVGTSLRVFDVENATRVA